jgi:hypothetical protein
MSVINSNHHRAMGRRRLISDDIIHELSERNYGIAVIFEIFEVGKTVVVTVMLSLIS